MPPGTQLSLTLQRDGRWAGTLAAGGKAVEFAGAENGGPQAVLVALARLWAREHGGGNRQSGRPPG